MAQITRAPAGLPPAGGIAALPEADDPPAGREATPPRAVGATPSLNGNGRLPRPSTPRRHLWVGDVLALAAAWTPQAIANTALGWGPRVLCATSAAAVTMVAIHGGGLYRSRICALPSAAARTIVAAMIGAGTFAGLERAFGVSAPGPSLEGGAAAALALLVVRWRFSHWVKARRSSGQFLRTAVLVGTNDDAAALWTTLNSEPELGYRIGAVAGDHVSGRPWEGLPTCTATEDLGALAERVGATGVIVVASALDTKDRETAVCAALDQGLHVRLWVGLSGVAGRRVRMAPVSGLPLIYVEPQRVARWQTLVKRALDVALATVMLMVTAPLLIAAGILIKLQDGGSVLYRSQRVGRSGAPISVLKLRTMVPDAAQMIPQVAVLNERTDGPLFKASDDPRVTRIGGFLRGMSMDELPQLWNVLNGTMSLVGPRPALSSEAEHFDAELSRRHEMRPGITGLWQIEARNNPSFNAYRRLDLSYVDNWSLRLDFAILASTVHAVVAGALSTVLVKTQKATGERITTPHLRRRARTELTGVVEDAS